MSNKGKVALITGGARRVGAAIVKALSQAGYTVIVHTAHSENEAHQLANQLRGTGADAGVVVGDLSSHDGPAAVVQKAVSMFGRLDVLVNSAANFVKGNLYSLDAEAWDSAFALNVRAPMLVSQAAARLMVDGGSIVNIADHLAFETEPGFLAHSTSKAALVHMSKTMARDLAPRIRVNVVVPGLVEPPAGWTETDVEKFVSAVPLGRRGKASDVASAVCWLVEAEYVTGAVLAVDGGISVAR